MQGGGRHGEGANAFTLKGETYVLSPSLAER